MLANILGLLKKSGAGSADLRQALTEIPTAEAKATVERLEAERRRLLLDGSEKDLKAVEETLASARRDLDRANAATEELLRRIAEAEAKEKADTLNAERKAVEDEAQAAADALRKEYPELTTKLVALLDRVTKANEAVSTFNSNVGKRVPVEQVRDYQITKVENRVFAGFSELVSASITGQTVVVRIDGLCPGWNDQNIRIYSTALKVA